MTSSTFIIAEIGINHNGDMKLVRKLIEESHKAGADAVKFQKRDISLVYSKEELAKYYTKVASSKEYKDKEYRFLWWHSHHTMQAFWSGTDIDAIEEFNESDFSFALVVNLKEEYLLRVSVWDPIEVHKDVELTIHNKEKDVPQSILKEVDKLCSKPKVTSMWNVSKGKNNSVQSSLFSINEKEETNEIDPEFESNYTAVWDQLESMLMDLANGLTNVSQFNVDINVLNMQLKNRKIPIIIEPITDYKPYHEPADYITVEDKYREMEIKMIEQLSTLSIYQHYM